MKKFAWLSLVTLLIIGLLSFGVLAQEEITIDCYCPPPEPDCLTVYDTETGLEADNAIAAVGGGYAGSCNKPVWDVAWLTHASVAQWVDFEFTGTAWYWYVRKPGDYYTDCNKLIVASNGDIEISFDGFADLQYMDVGNGVDETISTYYKFNREDTINPDDPVNFPDTAWISASALNDLSRTIADSQNLHDGIMFSLWNRIVVENCNSACEYEDEAIIRITLDNQKDWIDDEGGFIFGLNS
jgi:hypothetical protein